MTLHEFIQSRIVSFRHAFRGLRYVIRTQQNAWIHAVVTIMVLFLVVILNLPSRDWAILFVAICMVWMAEFLNTALEAVVDLASPTHHPLAKTGKDVGAAAVLITAITAVLVGLLILGPPLWSNLKIWLQH
jgi:diacylglycerol kinase (ATP)